MFSINLEIKFVKCLLKMWLLFSVSVGLDQKDKEHIWETFVNEVQPSYDPSNHITRDYFESYFKAEIFGRVSKVGDFLGKGSLGFVFYCDYTMPRSGQVVPAVVKFLHDFEDKVYFNINLLWAEISGNWMRDPSNPGAVGPFHFNQGKADVWVHLGKVRKADSLFINHLYEMQWTFAEGSKGRKEMTMLVTARGAQSLNSPIFEGDWNKGQDANTEEFLRLYVELCVGAMNINKHGVLHGDHKPENVVLEVGKGETLHVGIIDFDLSARWGESFDGFNGSLRYDSDLRAPSIEERSKPDPDASGPTAQPLSDEDNTLYYYSRDMREDTYAVALIFNELYELNQTEINERDVRVQNILDVVYHRITRDEFELETVPTTAEWVEIVESIISAGQEGAVLVTEYSKVKKAIKRTLSQPEAVKKAKPSSRQLNGESPSLESNQREIQMKNGVYIII